MSNAKKGAKQAAKKKGAKKMAGLATRKPRRDDIHGPLIAGTWGRAARTRTSGCSARDRRVRTRRRHDDGADHYAQDDGGGMSLRPRAVPRHGGPPARDRLQLLDMQQKRIPASDRAAGAVRASQRQGRP